MPVRDSHSVSVARLLLGCSTRALALIKSLSLRNVGVDARRNWVSFSLSLSPPAPSHPSPPNPTHPPPSPPIKTLTREYPSPQPFPPYQKKYHNSLARLRPCSTAALWAQAVAILVIGDLSVTGCTAPFTASNFGVSCRPVTRPSIIDWLYSGESTSGQRCIASCRRATRSKPRLCADRRGRHCAGPHVDGDFGARQLGLIPLRGVVASLRFHRWHHTRARIRDKNFVAARSSSRRIQETWLGPAWTLWRRCGHHRLRGLTTPGAGLFAARPCGEAP